MREERINRINAKHGFHFVSPSRKNGGLWEKKRIRLRISADTNDAQQPLHCETLIPYNCNILPFIFHDNEMALSSIQWFPDQIIIKDTIDRLEDYEQIVMRASNLDALLQREEVLEALNGLLSPLPRVPCDEGQLEEEVLDLLGRRLRQNRAIEIHASSYTLSAYLYALGVQNILEADPIKLIGQAERMQLLKTILECAGSLNSHLIVINMDIIVNDDQSYCGFTACLQRLNLLPEYGGARIILSHTTGVRTGNNPLPCLPLPDIFRKNYTPILEASGISQKTSTLHTVASLLRAGCSPDEIVAELQEESRWSHEEGNPLLSEIHFPAVPSGNKKGELALLSQEARALFDTHYVGHGEIISEVIPSIIAWKALNPSRPLVYLFSGPSGTGKNHLCKTISLFTRKLFRNPSEQYVAFNAGNIVNRTGIWALTGVQAGLKGMSAPGLLETIGIGGVLSIDELDKTSPDNEIQDFLVSLLEEGAFRNGFGKLVKLPPSIIVLTMNAGRGTEDENCKGIGFVSAADGETVKRHYRRAVDRHLHPALRGRINKSFFFNHLGREQLIEIGIRELACLQDRFALMVNEKWPLDNEAEIRAIADKLDPALGARAMLHGVEELWNKALETLMETPF